MWTSFDTKVRSDFICLVFGFSYLFCFQLKKRNENKVLRTVPVFLPLISPSHNNQTPFSKTKRRMHVCVWWHFASLLRRF